MDLFWAERGGCYASLLSAPTPRAASSRAPRSPRSLTGRRRVGARPQQGLRDDRGSLVDGQRGRAVQLVPELQGLADAIAERGIVRPGEHAITGKPVSRHATSLESQRRHPRPTMIKWPWTFTPYFPRVTAHDHGSHLADRLSGHVSPTGGPDGSSWAETPAMAGFWPAMTGSRRRAVTGDDSFPSGYSQSRITASMAIRRAQLVFSHPGTTSFPAGFYVHEDGGRLAERWCRESWYGDGS